jgi:hypothetical protein
MSDEGNGVKARVAIPSPTKHTEMITQKTDASPVLRVENNPRSQPPAGSSANGTRVAAPRRSRIGRHLESQAAAGTWTPWAEFVDGLRVVTKGRPRTDLTALELEAEVWRVDRTVTLAEHYADTAGLVRIRPAGGVHVVPDLIEPSRRQRDQAGWMSIEHGLTPHEGLPPTLLGLAGQHPGPEDDCLPASWLDHTATWIDRDGLPVLTCEPTHLDPDVAAQAARELLDLGLTVTSAPSPRGAAALLLISWAVDAQPLPAIALPRPTRRALELAA